MIRALAVPSIPRLALGQDEKSPFQVEVERTIRAFPKVFTSGSIVPALERLVAEQQRIADLNAGVLDRADPTTARLSFRAQFDAAIGKLRGWITRFRSEPPAREYGRINPEWNRLVSDSVAPLWVLSNAKIEQVESARHLRELVADIFDPRRWPIRNPLKALPWWLPWAAGGAGVLVAVGAASRLLPRRA